jgi:hypothetical protein
MSIVLPLALSAVDMKYMQFSVKPGYYEERNGAVDHV